MLSRIAFGVLLMACAGATCAPAEDNLFELRAGFGGSFLGVAVEDIDAARMEELSLPEERGAEVRNVEPGSPAEKAGLKAGDVVVEYNGARVEGAAMLVRMVRETPAGRQVKIGIRRAGTTQTLTAQVGKREGSWNAAPNLRGLREFNFRLPDQWQGFGEDSEIMRSVRPGPRLGIQADRVDGQLAEYFGVKAGVLIKSVDNEGPAAKAGLRAGDVIVKLGDEVVDSAGDITRILGRARSDGKTSLSLAYVRDKKQNTVTVNLPAAKPAAKATESVVM